MIIKKSLYVFYYSIFIFLFMLNIVVVVLKSSSSSIIALAELMNRSPIIHHGKIFSSSSSNSNSNNKRSNRKKSFSSLSNHDDNHDNNDVIKKIDKVNKLNTIAKWFHSYGFSSSSSSIDSNLNLNANAYNNNNRNNNNRNKYHYHSVLHDASEKEINKALKMLSNASLKMAKMKKWNFLLKNGMKVTSNRIVNSITSSLTNSEIKEIKSHNKYKNKNKNKNKEEKKGNNKNTDTSINHFDDNNLNSEEVEEEEQKKGMNTKGWSKLDIIKANKERKRKRKLYLLKTRDLEEALYSIELCELSICRSSSSSTTTSSSNNNIKIAHKNNNDNIKDIKKKKMISNESSEDLSPKKNCFQLISECKNVSQALLSLSLSSIDDDNTSNNNTTTSSSLSSSITNSNKEKNRILSSNKSEGKKKKKTDRYNNNRISSSKIKKKYFSENLNINIKYQILLDEKKNRAIITIGDTCYNNGITMFNFFTQDPHIYYHNDDENNNLKKSSSSSYYYNRQQKLQPPIYMYRDIYEISNDMLRYLIGPILFQIREKYPHVTSYHLVGYSMGGAIAGTIAMLMEGELDVYSNQQKLEEEQLLLSTINKKDHKKEEKDKDKDIDSNQFIGFSRGNTTCVLYGVPPFISSCDDDEIDTNYKSFIMSFINGDDYISRLSKQSMQDLERKIIEAIPDRHLHSFGKKLNTVQGIFKNVMRDTMKEMKFISSFKSKFTLNKNKNKNKKKIQMVVPGEIYYMKPYIITTNDSGTDSETERNSKTNNDIYTMSLVTADKNSNSRKNFKKKKKNASSWPWYLYEIVLSDRMFNDHLFSRYVTALANIKIKAD